MKIVDINGAEVLEPDFTRGYLKDDTMTVHHEAVEGVEEKYHYETVNEYENGGKDVRKIVDAPGVQASEAWDEVVQVMRYVLYTPEELAQIEAERAKPTTAEQIAELREALELLLSGVTE